MSGLKLDTGRVGQKLKTKDNILKAAQKLLRTKGEFSLEDVAEEMQISRATVYRYYSNIDLLCSEAALSILAKAPDEFEEDVKGLDWRQRIHFGQTYFNNLALDNEPAFRKYLSVVLSESLKEKKQTKFRGARRPAVFDVIMKPYLKKFDADTYKNLKDIFTVLSGIEPMIANKDVSGLDNDKSNQLLSWAMEMIMQGIEQKGKSK